MMNFRTNISLLILLACVCIISFGQQTFNPTKIARSSNSFGSLQTGQNLVITVDSLNLVAFIHRQDWSIHGGGTASGGKFRIAYSTDAGVTWSTEIGPMNPTQSSLARYPNVAFHIPDGKSDYEDGYFVYAGPTTPAGTNWYGHSTGVYPVDTNNNSLTEHYEFDNHYSGLVMGLTRGLPGEFWMTEWSLLNGYDSRDTLHIYKGTWVDSLQDVTWQRWDSMSMDTLLNHTSFNFTPQIEMAPGGDSTAWMAMIGDIPGGLDSVLNPILYKSTDGGNSWGDPVEIDLSQYAWLMDSLRDGVNSSVPPDTLSLVAPTTWIEFDLTVDGNGNPHMFFVVGWGKAIDTSGAPAWTGNYFLDNTFPMIAVDLTSRDGGQTFEPIYITPIYANHGQYGYNMNGFLLDMYNCTQISRDVSGEYIFYSWEDTRPEVLFPSGSFNEEPNIRFTGLRLTDSMRTCIAHFTDGHNFWDGRVYWSFMANEVLTVSAQSSDTCYSLPITYMDLTQSDPLSSVTYYYVGHEATFSESDFTDPFTPAGGPLTIGCKGQSCLLVSSEHPVKENDFHFYPNPASTSVSFVNQKAGRLQVFDLHGRLLYSNEISQAGEQSLDVSSFEPGIYLFKWMSEKQSFSQKILILP